MADGALDGIKEQSSRFSCYFFKLSQEKKKEVWCKTKRPSKRKTQRLLLSQESSRFLFSFFLIKKRKLSRLPQRLLLSLLAIMS